MLASMVKEDRRIKMRDNGGQSVDTNKTFINEYREYDLFNLYIRKPKDTIRGIFYRKQPELLMDGAMIMIGMMSVSKGTRTYNRSSIEILRTGGRSRSGIEL
jgi:hypothetical protein